MRAAKTFYVVNWKFLAKSNSNYFASINGEYEQEKRVTVKLQAHRLVPALNNIPGVEGSTI